MIRAASRNAIAELRARLDAETANLSSSELTQVAEQLYAVADLLVGQSRLRRILGDPSTAEQSRTQLVAQLLAG